jgi:hypothetical protein
MEFRLLMWVVIKSVIVRTENSYGGKFNVVGCDNIGIESKEISYEVMVIIVGGDNIGIVRTESSYGGKVLL